MKAKRILASVLSVALLLQLSPLNIWALDESLPQTPQVSTVQENLDPATTAEPIPEETAAPTPDPTAEPTATSAAEESAPDAAAAPTPEPSAEPTATPDPAAEVQAMIDALPGEVTNDNAAAVEQALTDIDDAKQSLTDDELAGLDFARYDAAANALSALWGEAPADAVELLDANAAPDIDPTDNFYEIDSVEDLCWLASASKYVKAKLTADIKLNGENKVLNDDGSLTSNADTLEKWTPIGVSELRWFVRLRWQRRHREKCQRHGFLYVRKMECRRYLRDEQWRHCTGLYLRLYSNRCQLYRRYLRL